MVYNPAIEAFYLRGWTDGFQPDMNQTQLGPGAVPDLLNVDFLPGGAIQKRRGYIEIGQAAVTDLDTAEHLFAPRTYTTSGAHPNFTQQCLYFNESDGSLYVQTMGELMEEYDTPGAGTDLVDTGHSLGPASPTAANYFRVHPIAVCVYGDMIYISSLRFEGFSGGSGAGGTWQTEAGSATGASLPIQYDVQAGTYTRLPVTTLAGVTGQFPRARCLLTKHERIFAANIHRQAATAYRYPSRIYWSHVTATATDETRWNSTDWLEVGADDGSEITALVSFKDAILVFKNTSVWILLGASNDTFSLDTLATNLGTEASLGVCVSPDHVYFYDYRYGIHRYDGAGFEHVGEPIYDRLQSVINRDAAFKVVAWYHDNKVYFSVPVGSFQADARDHNTTTFIYDTRLNVWTEYNYGVSGVVFYFTDYNVQSAGFEAPNRWFSGGNADQDGIFDNGTGDSDARPSTGVAVLIDGYFQTIWINPKEVGERHRLRRLDALLDITSDTITIDMYRDLLDTTPFVTASINPSGSEDEYHLQNQSFDQGLWSWAKFRFRNATLNEWFRINGIGMYYSTRATGRGTVAGTGYTA